MYIVINRARSLTVQYQCLAPERIHSPLSWLLIFFIACLPRFSKMPTLITKRYPRRLARHMAAGCFGRKRYPRMMVEAFWVSV